MTPRVKGEDAKVSAALLSDLLGQGGEAETTGSGAVMADEIGRLLR